MALKDGENAKNGFIKPFLIYTLWNIYQRQKQGKMARNMKEFSHCRKEEGETINAKY